MRSLIALALAFLAIGVQAQDTKDTYGKTNAQILAMGRDRWYTFYTSKAGDSTAAMSSAYGFYYDAATARNDALIAKAGERKATATKLRKLLTDYCNEALGLGENNTGGGTMWNPISGSCMGDEEDVVYAYLVKKGPSAKKIVVSTVTKKLDSLGALIEKTHKDPSATYFKYEDAKESLKKMRSDFADLTALAKSFARADSDRVLRFCLEMATTAVGDES